MTSASSHQPTLTAGANSHATVTIKISAVAVHQPAMTVEYPKAQARWHIESLATITSHLAMTADHLIMTVDTPTAAALEARQLDVLDCPVFSDVN